MQYVTLKNPTKNSLKLKYNYIKLYKPQLKDAKSKLINNLYSNLPKIIIYDIIISYILSK